MKPQDDFNCYWMSTEQYCCWRSLWNEDPPDRVEQLRSDLSAWLEQGPRQPVREVVLRAPVADARFRNLVRFMRRRLQDFVGCGKLDALNFFYGWVLDGLPQLRTRCLEEFEEDRVFSIHGRGSLEPLFLSHDDALPPLGLVLLGRSEDDRPTVTVFNTSCGLWMGGLAGEVSDPADPGRFSPRFFALSRVDASGDGKVFWTDPVSRTWALLLFTRDPARAIEALDDFLQPTEPGCYEAFLRHQAQVLSRNPLFPWLRARLTHDLGYDPEDAQVAVRQWLVDSALRPCLLSPVLALIDRGVLILRTFLSVEGERESNFGYSDHDYCVGYSYDLSLSGVEDSMPVVSLVDGWNQRVRDVGSVFSQFSETLSEVRRQAPGEVLAVRADLIRSLLHAGFLERDRIQCDFEPGLFHRLVKGFRIYSINAKAFSMLQAMAGREHADARDQGERRKENPQDLLPAMYKEIYTEPGLIGQLVRDQWRLELPELDHECVFLNFVFSVKQSPYPELVSQLGTLQVRVPLRAAFQGVSLAEFLQSPVGAHIDLWLTLSAGGLFLMRGAGRSFRLDRLVPGTIVDLRDRNQAMELGSLRFCQVESLKERFGMFGCERPFELGPVPHLIVAGLPDLEKLAPQVIELEKTLRVQNHPAREPRHD